MFCVLLQQQYISPNVIKDITEATEGHPYRKLEKRTPGSYAEYFTLERSDPHHGVYGLVIQEYHTKHVASRDTTL
jgi:hypothetical protein